MAQGRPDRLAIVSKPVGSGGLRHSYSQNRTERSANLHRRMRFRDFLSAEEGIRHTAETGRGCDCSAAKNAGNVATRPNEPEFARETVCQSGHSIGALDRSSAER